MPPVGYPETWPREVWKVDPSEFTHNNANECGEGQNNFAISYGKVIRVGK